MEAHVAVESGESFEATLAHRTLDWPFPFVTETHITMLK